jgi:hypothetical protein
VTRRRGGAVIGWCPVCFVQQFLDSGELVEHYADGRAAPEDAELDFDERCEGSYQMPTATRPVRTSDPDAVHTCPTCDRPVAMSDFAVAGGAGLRWHIDCWDIHVKPGQGDLLALLGVL